MLDNNNSTFGKRLSMEMLRLGISPKSLKVFLGVTQPAISGLVNDERKSIKFTEIDKMQELGFNMNYLLFNKSASDTDFSIKDYDKKVQVELNLLQSKLIACMEDKKELEKQVQFYGSIQEAIDEEGETTISAAQFKVLADKVNIVLDGLRKLEKQKKNSKWGGN